MAGRPSVVARMLALAGKETLQLLRDRATLGMLLGVPLVQVLLFGFAIELTPKSLPVTLVSSAPGTAADLEDIVRDELGGVTVHHTGSMASARRLLSRGETVLVVDADDSPIRILVDATDPVLAAHALAAVERITRRLVANDSELAEFANETVVEKLFNPELRTQPFLVSGLLGMILTMTLVMMSALTVARERERGTLEGLVMLSVQPLELAVGKLAPYLLLGIMQGLAVLLVAWLAFDVTVTGSAILLAAASTVFYVANLALGFLFSNLAQAQMPAMQMTFFFFLPSSLLSGFMFPFIAMPTWAQRGGELLPLTHFLRIVRGLVLRDVDPSYVMGEVLPIAAFAVVTLAAALWRCGRQLRGA